MSSNSSATFQLRPTKKTRGYALLAGLKSVDSSAYGGWTGENGCWGCELDVDNMARILRPLGYTVGEMKTKKATAAGILDALRMAAQVLKAGDIFVFYFSGHGGTAVDTSGDEIDNQDETLIAYDRPLIDDELAAVWNEFRAGVRIVMLSDSCHSGTNFRALGGQRVQAPAILGTGQLKGIKAQLIHMGGCRDDGTSSGYTGGGAFTTALCDIWQNGAFQGTYKDLLDQIAVRIAATQTPQYNEYGKVSPGFRGQKPFTIASPNVILPLVAEPLVAGVETEGSTVEATPLPSLAGALKVELIKAISEVFDRFGAEAGRDARHRTIERATVDSPTTKPGSGNGASARV